MPNCAVAKCKNCNKSTKGTDIKYFSFPKNEDMADQWIIACRREEKINLKNGTICSIHFEDKYFEVPLRQRMLNYTPKNARHLKVDAIPTLNLPERLSLTCQKRKSNNRSSRLGKKRRREEVEDVMKAIPGTSICTLEKENNKLVTEELEGTIAQEKLLTQPSIEESSELAMALATSGKKWRESDTIKFVELYEQAECLWNYRHPGYKNRNARDKAIQHIIDKMNLPDFGGNELKNKIKNIRSTYQQEVNKIKRSKAGFAGDCGYVLEEYKTNLAWFPIADRFLSTCINSTKNIATKSEIDDGDNSSMFQNNQSGLFSLVETEMTGELDQHMDQKFSPSYVTIDHHIKEEPIKEEYNSITPQYNHKKRRVSQHHFLEAGDLRPEEFDFQSSMDNTHGDEWYHFGNNVACQLRNMPLERALVSQRRIMEVLTEERIEALKRDKEELKKNDSGD